MILFFQSPTKTVLAVEAAHAFSPEDVQKLVWLFSEAAPLQSETLDGWYVGPRREMIPRGVPMLWKSLRTWA